MEKTLNLINTFWEEYEDVKIRRLHLAGLNQGGFCQCSTENFIRRIKDPIEMRSFFNDWNPNRSKYSYTLLRQ